MSDVLVRNPQEHETLATLKVQGGNGIASGDGSKETELKQLFGGTLSLCMLWEKATRIWLRLRGHFRGL
jgi:hypothetical protein